MQVDGFFYQDEGRYRCIDSNSISSQSVNYANSAGSVAWSNVSDKPINFKAYSGSLASGGWYTMQGNNSSPSIAISYNTDAASWNSGTYSATLVYGCYDTRGLLDCAYNSPVVTFGGCYYGGSNDNNPTWYMKISGTSGTTYDLNSMPYAASAGSAGSSTYSSYLKGPDNRSTNNAPSWYMSNSGAASLYGEFCSAGGATGEYEYRMTMTPWGDSSGQSPVQMAFNNSGAYIRTSASDSAWNSWYKLATTSDISWSNVTSKPFNWSGQSGQPTWLWGSNDGTNYYVWDPSNFNVNYANSAGSAGYIQGGQSTTSDWNLGANTGIRILNTVGESATGAPGDYHIGLSVSGYYGFQLAAYGGGGRLLYRNTCRELYPGWSEIAYLSDLGSYLPLSGGYMNGSIDNNGEYSYIGYMPRKSASGGGWAYDIVACRDAANSRFMHLGVCGDNNSLAYIYLGPNDFSGSNLRIDSSGNVSASRFIGTL
jgi:hypothetical protein